ncbi:MAG: hypothetical protein M3Z09_06280 [Acidobacteriota bacterium]|nr:hypothetical protein [Acidobacteriota bacterium]
MTLSNMDTQPIPTFADEAEEAQWWYQQRDQLTANAEAALARGEIEIRGLPYQTYLKMLFHEALDNEEKHFPS